MPSDIHHASTDTMVDARTPHPGLEDLLSLHVSWVRPDALVMAIGEIDHFTAPLLRRRLREVLGGDPGRLLIDLSAVPFVDLGGLRVLSSVGRELRERGGCLVAVDPPSTLRRLIGALGVEVSFEMVLAPWRRGTAPTVAVGL